MTTNAEFLCTSYRSPVGMIYLLTKDAKLLALGLCQRLEDFKKQNSHYLPETWKWINPDQDEFLKEIVWLLNAYFDEGRPLPSDISLEPEGTPFQRKVWNKLQKIPFGKTVSYGQIAQQIGSPGAARAVGAACGANPIPLFIPCHRVLASGGQLGGFGSGLAVKEQLLVHEEIGG